MKVIPPTDKIILKNDKREDKPIKAKSIYQPRLNLGHYKSPDGNLTTQIVKLKRRHQI